MPSELQQLNVRVLPQTMERLVELQKLLGSERGCAVSQAEAIAGAIVEAVEKRVTDKRKPARPRGSP